MAVGFGQLSNSIVEDYLVSDEKTFSSRHLEELLTGNGTFKILTSDNLLVSLNTTEVRMIALNRLTNYTEGETVYLNQLVFDTNGSIGIIAKIYKNSKGYANNVDIQLIYISPAMVMLNKMFPPNSCFTATFGNMSWLPINPNIWTDYNYADSSTIPVYLGTPSTGNYGAGTDLKFIGTSKFPNHTHRWKFYCNTGSGGSHTHTLGFPKTKAPDGDRFAYAHSDKDKTFTCTTSAGGGHSHTYTIAPKVSSAGPENNLYFPTRVPAYGITMFYRNEVVV